MKLFLLLLLISTFLSNNIEAQCGAGSQYQFLDINNVKARINDADNLWYVPLGLHQGDSVYYEIKEDSGKTSSLAGALWIGGIDQNNQLHVAANTYRQNGVDFFPGPLDSIGQVNSTICSKFDSLWKINKSTIDSFKTSFVNSGGNLSSSQIPGSILYWPAHSNPFNPIVGNRSVAPFFDFNGDGIYNPTQGDYPLIKGDQEIFWVFNDAGNTHGETGGLPLGIEVHASAYAYINTLSCDVSNATFYNFDIENKSDNTYHDLYTALWIDPDININYADKYIGCDTVENMSFFYNGAPTYSSGQFPVSGIKILSATTTDTILNKPLSGMMYYNNDFTVTGNPQKASDYYNYMQAIWTDSTHLTYGGTGYGGSIPAHYAFPGNPSDSSGWSECAQHDDFGDRRVVLSSGSLNVKPGDHIYLTYAVLCPQLMDTISCPPFSSIDSLANCVQTNFNNGNLNSIKNIVTGNIISIMPNPASSILIIVLNNASNNNLVSVYDMTGRTVSVSVINEGNKILLDVSSLASAVYIVVIKDVNGNTAVKKFVKE